MAINRKPTLTVEDFDFGTVKRETKGTVNVVGVSGVGPTEDRYGVGKRTADQIVNSLTTVPAIRIGERIDRGR